MKIALLVICLLEFNVITLLIRNIIAKNKSRNLWRNRYEKLAAEYSDVESKNRILAKTLHETTEKCNGIKKNYAYGLVLYDIAQNIPLGMFTKIRRDNNGRF